MNQNDLYTAFNEVDDDILERSETAPRNKKKSSRLKLGVLAACLCLLVSVTIPILFPKGGQSMDDLATGDSAPLIFNGCFYELLDDPQLLAIHGLPTKITADMAGDHVAYIDANHNHGYMVFGETPVITDMELYVFAPAPSRAVYVLRDRDSYMVVYFCRTYFPGDPNAYCDLAEVYRIFNIEDAGDIASITPVDWNRSKITGAKITDTNAIAEFYALTTDIVNFISMDNDAFQKQVFSGIPEEDAQAAHNAFADDLQVLRIETVDGLRFFVNIYPSYGYLYSSGAMAYHQITPELSEWFAEYLGRF